MLCREEQIDGFWLVSVILIVCNRLLFAAWNIISDSRTAKHTVLVFFVPHYVSCSNFCANSQVFIRKQLPIGWFTLNALCSVPLTLHVTPFAIDVMLRQWVETLAQISYGSKLILGDTLHVLYLFPYNGRLWEVLVNTFRLN